MTMLAWSAVDMVEEERKKRLVIEARQQKMRVKKISGTQFQVKGISLRDKKPSTHIIRIEAKRGLLCNCEWGTRYPYIDCKHTSVVKVYLGRIERQKAKATKQATTRRLDDERFDDSKSHGLVFATIAGKDD